MSNFSNAALGMFLASSINSSATSVTVSNVQGGAVADPASYGWPDAPFYAEIDGGTSTPEVVKVTSNVSGTLTIQRPTGQPWAFKSVASSHTVGAAILPVLAAGDILSLAATRINAQLLDGGTAITGGDPMWDALFGESFADSGVPSSVPEYVFYGETLYDS